MDKLNLTLWIILGILLVSVNSNAQTGSQTPPQQAPNQIGSQLDLRSLLGMDLDEMFGEAFKELESSRSIWEQYIDPSLVDSALNKMTDPMIGESFDALFKNLEDYLNQEDGIGSMFDQLLQNFSMPLNGLPFPLGPDIEPEEFNGEDWQIIPNVPTPATPKEQDQGTPKKGVSVI